MTGYFLTVRLDERWYAVPVYNIDTVRHLVVLDDAIDMPPEVVGMLFQGDRTVPVLDLRRQPSALDFETPMVILRQPAAAIVADEIGDVCWLNDRIDSHISPLPDLNIAIPQ